MTPTNLRRLGALLLAVASVVALAACGSDGGSSGSGGSSSGTSSSASAEQPGKGTPTLTLGAKNFTEEFILGQLYKQALEAKGYTVELKNNIGSSEVTDKALTSGRIDMYPEYTGVIQAELAGIDKRPQTAEQTYREAKAFEEKRGFTLLEKTPFFDADGLAVLPEFARKNGLKTAGDLRKLDSFTYGGPPENRTRFQGVVGMKKEYGLTNLKFKPLSIGLQYQALKAGKIDVAAIFTTDGQLKGGNYVVLDDTKGIFGFQNVAPVISKRKLAAMGPEFPDVVNAVSAKLTNEAMQTMNAAVDLDKQDPAAVAEKFLRANGLVGA